MKKVMLIIRDGRGYRKETENNAIAQVDTPFTDNLMKNYPNILLNTSGEDVGLPAGYQGNSEVGHMTIGSGRIIFQSLERINHSIKDGSFFEIDALKGAIENCKKHSSTLHLMGILQGEGVHAHIDHLFALLDLCDKENFHNVNIHVFTDGRDAPVTKSLEYLGSLEKKLKTLGFGKICTIMGRFYAMDRDKRWDRTQIAYDAICNAKTDKVFDNMIEGVKESHNNGETDEFIKPIVLKGYEGIKEHDSIIFWNFRTDRTRQLTKAIVEPVFEGWNRSPLNVYYVGMTQFYDSMNALVAFPELEIKNGLGEVVSNAGLRQLRISETEKYAHVTFFFNGQVEAPFRNEDRILIPSPKVQTYDLKPEMSAYEITDAICEKIENDNYNLIITNLVNGDMIGHTGVIDAIHKAVKTVDDCVGKLVEYGLKNGYEILVFADHGNVEDQSEERKTSHTTNPVPFILVSDKKYKLESSGGLVDIAPTVLELLGIEKPNEMTGKSLIKI
ncbi:MAG TPA: 2,3-bisphosphoglycerate-independent phosphoglycerate mutase [Candidatus Absconditabacterales bacterium]|nr:2,3-bisphosphoglycerate-independent phosphoglycerate mutase [Candidatus Absconditabacterales bacterium]